MARGGPRLPFSATDLVSFQPTFISSSAFSLASVVQGTPCMHPALWTRCSSHVMGCITASAKKGSPHPGRFSKLSLFRGNYGQVTPSRTFCSFVHNRSSTFPTRPLVDSQRPALSPHRRTRQISWIPGLKRGDDIPEGSREGQEEAAKSSILEKAMKGRQPADLMLRCECSSTSLG